MASPFDFPLVNAPTKLAEYRMLSSPLCSHTHCIFIETPLCLDRKLDQITLDRGDAAFVIAVSCYAGAAGEFVAVCFQPCGQCIHRFPAACAERNVRVSGAGGFFGGIC